jgi:uncharacterized protein
MRIDAARRAVTEGPAWRRWAVLLTGSLALAALLAALHLPAGMLLGPMAAAIALAVAGAPVAVHPWAFRIAQAVVGLMIARVLPASIIAETLQRGPLFLGCVLSVVLAAVLLGLLLQRWRLLPGTSALWGTFPGAASAMALMSQAFGGDMRVVALMQYLRVVVVAIAAALVAHAWHAGAAPPGPSAPAAWLSLGDPRAAAATLALLAACVALAARLRFPASPLLLPLLVGVLLQDSGLLRITLSAPLLAASYALLGWSIGLRFTADVLRSTARALPRMLAAIVVLVALCAGIAWVLVRFAGIDPLTAYLATSPGGADSVAIIAASAPQVDVAFVMTMQTARLLVVLTLGPLLARWLGRRLQRTTHDAGTR